MKKTELEVMNLGYCVKWKNKPNNAAVHRSNYLLVKNFENNSELVIRFQSANLTEAAKECSKRSFMT